MSSWKNIPKIWCQMDTTLLRLYFLHWSRHSKNQCNHIHEKTRDFFAGPVVKNQPSNAGDTCWIPGLRRSPMPWGNEAHAQLLKPTSSRACALCTSRSYLSEKPIDCKLPAHETETSCSQKLTQKKKKNKDWNKYLTLVSPALSI